MNIRYAQGPVVNPDIVNRPIVRVELIGGTPINGQKGVKDSFGGNVFYAGHINYDKYGDFIVGAYDYFRTSREGRAYLFYGGSKTTIDTDYDHVFEENVAPMTDFGKEGKLCDLNGDGRDDVILGAWQYNNGQGRVYVYFNKALPSKSLR